MVRMIGATTCSSGAGPLASQGADDVSKNTSIDAPFSRLSRAAVVMRHHARLPPLSALVTFTALPEEYSHDGRVFRHFAHYCWRFSRRAGEERRKISAKAAAAWQMSAREG